ncbi:neurotransmitter-gated ion-channel ligand-binding protein [Stylonychia lemnae]|uniref:Neurotransmitter-gated ion-channel ligand-binding protein n=1 Tax=Stylonychia lemnae TaxID=5949 RepID=A0A078AXP1_STYLE|nr:neurotransmitter-gated ion-channel ligand-binding protein [Stylonychia lemnae]|eukprot:CDW86914.1 neurotransmitter-gated ion-channel ligand-binding protein [Stylonychia lemnae]
MQKCTSQTLPLIVTDDLFKNNKTWPLGLSVNIYNILKIDTGVEQTFQVSFILKTSWYEEKMRHIEKDTIIKDHDDFERPKLQVMNAQGIEIYDEKMKALKGGLMIYKIKYNATIKENFELWNFPFDYQPLHLRIRATSPVQNIVFHESFRFGGRDQCKFEDSDLADFEFREDLTRVIFDNSKQRNEFIYQVVYKRSRAYYYFHIYLPLFILEFITFNIAMLNPADNFADAINIILISLLTQITFRLGLADILPKVAYLTLVDYYFLLNIIYSLFLSITEIVFYFIEVERDERIYYFLVLFGSWAFLNIIYFLVLACKRFTFADCDEQIRLLAGKTNAIIMKDVHFIKKKEK